MRHLAFILSLQLVASLLPAQPSLLSLSPLQKVFHEELFAHHGITSSHTTRLVHSHFDKALRSNSSEALPFLGCGPSEPQFLDEGRGKEHKARALLGAGRVHVARDLHAQKEICLLLLASPDEILQLVRYTDSTWCGMYVSLLLKKTLTDVQERRRHA